MQQPVERASLFLSASWTLENGGARLYNLAYLEAARRRSAVMDGESRRNM